MKDTINTLLLPVRPRIEYVWSDAKGFKERVASVECANGELLTGSVPFSWMYYICSCLNRKYVAGTIKGYQVSDPIAVLRIEGLPIQKADSQIVGQDKDGNLAIVENPEYTASIKRADLQGEEIYLERWCQLPIREPIMVTCIYNVNGMAQYDLAQCNAWILDMLHRLHIIHSNKHHTVRSTDGSRFRLVKESPFTLVIIRKMEG